MLHRRSLGRFAAAALAAAGTLAAASDARAVEQLTTGNGHGFQIFDASQHKITQFLEHPYRFLGPQPGAPPPNVPQGDGVPRRDLAYDMYFGIRAPGGAGWLNAPESAGAPEYVDQSNIIRAPAKLAGVDTESYFFAPFGLERNVMVAVLHAPGADDGLALFNFHMGAGRPDPGTSGESTRAGTVAGSVVETGPGGGAMVYVPLSAIAHRDCQGPYPKIADGLGDAPACDGDDLAVGFQAALAGGWMAVAAAYVDDASQADAVAQEIATWGAGRTPEAILKDARAAFEAWRKPPPADLCTEDETKLWRQSEAVLRMGQVREPNVPGRKNHGMILAALPPGVWHVGWVRDAQYAVVALARMGHVDEAKMALDFYLNAEPVGKYKAYVRDQDYRISVVRYFGNGEEEADYSGQSSPNVEMDGWGMVLWSARQYVEASGDTAWLASATRDGSVYDVLRGGVAVPLEANLEPSGIVAADSSIWEVHDANKRHFAYTTMAAARGFCDLAAIAKKIGRADDVTALQGLAERVEKGWLTQLVDADGALASSLEEIATGKYDDGALAEAFTWNLLPSFTGATATKTLTRLDGLRVASGGYKRNDDSLSTYDDKEWLVVDFRIADALRRAGRAADADALLATIVQKAAANDYLLPELYNTIPADGTIGAYDGSIPMVGFGAGAYVLTMLDRAGLIEPNDCGDGAGKTLPKRACSPIPPDADAGPPSLDGGVDGPLGEAGAGSPAAAPPSDEGGCACDLAHQPVGAPWMVALALAAPALLVARRRRRA